MPSTNDFLSKPVISLKEGKNCGILTNMLFDDDLKQVKAALVFDQTESAYNIIDITKVIKTQNDAVVIQTADDVVPYDGKVFNPINFDVFDTNGRHLGIVSEIILNKNCTVKSIECGHARLSPDRIYSHSDDTLVVKPQAVKQPSAKRKKDKSETAATDEDGGIPTVLDTVLSAMENADAPSEQRTAEVFEDEVLGASRSTAGTGSFLIGRRCDKNILNRFNEIIVRQGGVITADTIRKAKLSGKLLELSIHAVK